nr:MAG TPA: hypothetical protein [Caudoviricetes sp.]
MKVCKILPFFPSIYNIYYVRAKCPIFVIFINIL